MLNYRVFKRGDRFRVAAPYRFFWYWYIYGIDIWETESFTEAKELAIRLNKAEKAFDIYKRSSWEEYWKE